MSILPRSPRDVRRLTQSRSEMQPVELLEILQNMDNTLDARISAIRELADRERELRDSVEFMRVRRLQKLTDFRQSSTMSPNKGNTNFSQQQHQQKRSASTVSNQKSSITNAADNNNEIHLNNHNGGQHLQHLHHQNKRSAVRDADVASDVSLTADEDVEGARAFFAVKHELSTLFRRLRTVVTRNNRAASERRSIMSASSFASTQDLLQAFQGGVRFGNASGSAGGGKIGDQEMTLSAFEALQVVEHEKMKRLGLVEDLSKILEAARQDQVDVIRQRYLPTRRDQEIEEIKIRLEKAKRKLLEKQIQEKRQQEMMLWRQQQQQQQQMYLQQIRGGANDRGSGGNTPLGGCGSAISGILKNPSVGVTSSANFQQNQPSSPQQSLLLSPPTSSVKKTLSFSNDAQNVAPTVSSPPPPQPAAPPLVINPSSAPSNTKNSSNPFSGFDMVKNSFENDDNNNNNNKNNHADPATVLNAVESPQLLPVITVSHVDHTSEPTVSQIQRQNKQNSNQQQQSEKGDENKTMQSQKQISLASDAVPTQIVPLSVPLLFSSTTTTLSPLAANASTTSTALPSPTTPRSTFGDETHNNNNNISEKNKKQSENLITLSMPSTSNNQNENENHPQQETMMDIATIGSSSSSRISPTSHSPEMSLTTPPPSSSKNTTTTTTITNSNSKGLTPQQNRNNNNNIQNNNNTRLLTPSSSVSNLSNLPSASGMMYLNVPMSNSSFSLLVVQQQQNQQSQQNNKMNSKNSIVNNNFRDEKNTAGSNVAQSMFVTASSFAAMNQHLQPTHDGIVLLNSSSSGLSAASNPKSNNGVLHNIHQKSLNSSKQGNNNNNKNNKNNSETLMRTSSDKNLASKTNQIAATIYNFNTNINNNQQNDEDTSFQNMMNRIMSSGNNSTNQYPFSNFSSTSSSFASPPVPSREKMEYFVSSNTDTGQNNIRNNNSKNTNNYNASTSSSSSYFLHPNRVCMCSSCLEQWNAMLQNFCTTKKNRDSDEFRFKQLKFQQFLVRKERDELRTTRTVAMDSIYSAIRNELKKKKELEKRKAVSFLKVQTLVAMKALDEALDTVEATARFECFSQFSVLARQSGSGKREGSISSSSSSSSSESDNENCGNDRPRKITKKGKRNSKKTRDHDEHDEELRITSDTTVDEFFKITQKLQEKFDKEQEEEIDLIGGRCSCVLKAVDIKEYLLRRSAIRKSVNEGRQIWQKWLLQLARILEGRLLLSHK